MIKTSEEIDAYRGKGFRPGVVGCFLNDNNLLLVYKKEHNLWQLPQGGVDNRESLEEAFQREMSEELGEEFVSRSHESISLVTEGRVEFPAQKYGVRELETDSGQPIIMKGKKYFFLAAISYESELKLGETEFDDYRWVSYQEGTKLTEKIYQKGKKRITQNALKSLKKLGLIK